MKVENMRKHLGPGVAGWAISLKYMMSIVVLMGFVICGLYWWVNTVVPLPTRSKKKKVRSQVDKKFTYIEVCVFFVVFLLKVKLE